MPRQYISIPRAVCICIQCGREFTTHQSEAKRGGGKFCNRDCYRLHRPDGMPIEDRFWLKVDRLGPGECWPWLATRQAKGYGQFSIKNVPVRMQKAHRVAWFLATGAWPPSDLDVLHTCDYPPCVRNDDAGWYEVNSILRPRWGHLWLGTNADNVADKVSKGRAVHLSGTSHPNSKLSDEAIRTMRERYDSGEANQTELATLFGITQSTVWGIVRRKHWRHVV